MEDDGSLEHPDAQDFNFFSFKNDPNDALEGMLLSSALVAQEMSIAQIVCGVPGASISLSLIILLRLVSPKICENSFCD